MSTSENPFLHEMAGKNENAASTASLTNPAAQKSLRWWPAAGLLALMVAIRAVPMLMESPNLPVMMLGFMGPAVVCLLILAWWLFASRAPMREKLTGLICVVALGVVSVSFMHFSMQGMSVMFYQIPTGIGLFALVLVILANRPASRLRTAVVCTAAGLGFWDLVRSEGVTGRFDAEFAWRWSPTSEQEYLDSLADRNSGTRSDLSGNLHSAETTDSVTRNDSHWSDFRGPLRDGKQPGIVLNEDWQSVPPRLIWKSKVGPGWSSFTVAGNRLFTQEQRGDNEAVVCLNAETGSVLWVREYSGRFWEAIAGAGPRATPTIGDGGLYSLGANGNLMCLNPVNGDVRWERKLQSDASTSPPIWGFSSSPLVHGDLVIIHAGGSGDKGVLAYDAITGEPRWSVASGNHSYSSPQPAAFDGVEGILMLTNNGLQFLNSQDGTVIWNHDWPFENYRVTQPLVVGNSVLIATSLGVGTRRLSVKREGDSWNVSEDWTSHEMKPDFNDFVEHQGYVYGFDGNIFACMDIATGKRMWKKGRYGNGQVLLLSDLGQLLVVSEKGELILISADPVKHIETGKIQAIEGKTWNHPVLVGNRVYLRNSEEAACYELALNPAASL